MGRLPAPERRFLSMVAAGAGYQVAIPTVVDSMGRKFLVASTAVARHKVLHRVAGISSDICKQHGGGKWSNHFRAP